MLKSVCQLAIIIVAAVVKITSLQLVCYSHSIIESTAIYSFFHGSPRGFFVDLFPAHPIVDSNTIYLSSQGWRGINVISQASVLTQFLHSRKDDINILTQLTSPNSNPPTQNISSTPFSQICRTFFHQKPQFLSLQAQTLSSFVFSNDWQQEKCKPQLILIKQYGEQKLPQQKIVQLNQYGYEQANSYQNFVVLIQKTSIKKFHQSQETNKHMLDSRQLIGLSRILKGIGQHIINKPLTMDLLKNGNEIPDVLSIAFASHNSLVNAGELAKQNEGKVRNYLIMEFSPISNALVLPSIYKSDHFAVNEVQRYYHIEFEQEVGEKYHLYIFVHDFQTQNINHIIQRLDGLGIDRFDQSDIIDYSIDSIEKFKIHQPAKPGVTGLDEENTKQNIILYQQKIKTMESLLEKNKKQLTDAKKASQQAEEKYLKKQLQLQQVIKSKSSSDTHKDKTIGLPKEQSHISDLTPEAILKNKQVKNTTAFVVILVCSIFGSVTMTAVITACLVKRKYRAQTRDWIKNNAQMQDVQEIRTEQASQDKFSQSAKEHQKP